MSGVGIRWAGIDDAVGVADVHVASWRAAYPGLIEQRVLDGLSVAKRAEGWSRILTERAKQEPTGTDGPSPHRLLVAEREARIVGWASFGAGRDDGSSDRGELAGLYVHPDFWSEGVGHALIVAVERDLADAGFRSAYLWVLFGNDRAALFYRRHGWVADGTEKVGDAGGATALRELRYVRSLPRPSTDSVRHVDDDVDEASGPLSS